MAPFPPRRGRTPGSRSPRGRSTARLVLRLMFCTFDGLRLRKLAPNISRHPGSRSWRRSFRLTSPRTRFAWRTYMARDWLFSHPRIWEAEHDLELVVAELVANAVVQGEAPIVLELEERDATIHVEVSDA